MIQYIILHSLLQWRQDLYLLGQIQNGVPRGGRLNGEWSDWSDADPNDLFENYGVDDEGQEERQNTENADADAELIMFNEGLFDDMESEDNYNFDWESSNSEASLSSEDDVNERVQRQLNHKSAKVSRLVNPYASRNQEQQFWLALAHVQEHGLVPRGYGFRPEEEGYGCWNDIEYLTVGKKRSGKNHKCSLPQEIWHPRAVRWVQALEGMTASLE
jgi:hypothetical protein